MGRVGEPAQGEVLSADQGRNAPASARSRVLGTDIRGHRLRARRGTGGYMNVSGPDAGHDHSTAEDRRKFRASLLARLRSFLTALIFRRRMERDMAEEWQFHL